jgi:hypothetical protein
MSLPSRIKQCTSSLLERSHEVFFASFFSDGVLFLAKRTYKMKPTILLLLSISLRVFSAIFLIFREYTYFLIYSEDMYRVTSTPRTDYIVVN